MWGGLNFNFNGSIVLGDLVLQRYGIIKRELSAVKDRLEQVGIKWAIFAGAAACCYGSKREVTDIDILVKYEDLDKAKSALKDIHLEWIDIGYAHAGNEIRTEQGTCLFFLDDKMIKRIQSKKFSGVTVPVISVEDNIVFKAILQRGEEQGKHDIEDVIYMMKNEKIDFEYLEKRIQKCQAEKRVRPLLQRLIPEKN